MSRTPWIVSLPAPAVFFALTFALLLHPISTGSHHGASQRHLQKRLEEVFHRFSPLVTSHATLNHGNDCISPYEEKLRQQIVEELHLIATSHATLGRVKDAIKKMEEFISMNDKELCNYRLSLMCDQDTRKCVCGPTRVNVTFVWEEQNCRYAEGSMCAASSKVDCADGTHCISMTTLEPCTSGLCFCQRDYYPTTTQAPSSTREGMGYPAGVQIFSGSEEAQSANSVVKGSGLGKAKPTKESFRYTSSSEEDDDDDGDGEAEQIIVVKVSDVEKSFNRDAEFTTRESSHSMNNGEGEVDIPGDVSQAATTAAAPVATSAPTPTRRQELASAILQFERDVEAIQNLGFGDECSSISEESNYKEYRRLKNDMNCVTAENDEDILLEILSKLETILDTQNNMCNWTQHLQCHTQSKTCQCRLSSEDVDGYYLLFKEEARRCVLVENSRCLSAEFLISKKAPFIDIPCVSDSKCISEETKTECTSKLDNCFCRKLPRPTESSKQKKSKPKAKTSSAPPTYYYPIQFSNFHSSYSIIIVFLSSTLLQLPILN